MSDDIVARIRSEAMPACRRDVDYVPAFQNLMHAYLVEAADEIERLRDDNAKLRGEVEVLLHMRGRREAPTDGS